MRRSALGVKLEAQGRLGPQVRVRVQVQLYHRLPWIGLTWEFVFEQASIGSFFDDDSKLRVQWPLAFRGEIQHDIAFGVTSSLPDRPFFPATWVDISDGERGLAYLHQGTPKHWLADDVLVNLLGWGESTDAIGNRLGLGRWPKAFDQRLNGRHTLRAAIYPHPGDWRAAEVTRVARSFAAPPSAYLNGSGPGQLPASLNMLELTGTELHATAVKAEADQVVCRVYSASQQPQAIGLRLNGLKPAGLLALTGEPLREIGSYQIAMLRLEPEAAGQQEVERE
ncbi:MAG: hypothetical protein ABI847_10140 [Anaerolineales bacterium]